MVRFFVLVAMVTVAVAVAVAVVVLALVAGGMLTPRPPHLPKTGLRVQTALLRLVAGDGSAAELHSVARRCCSIRTRRGAGICTHDERIAALAVLVMTQCQGLPCDQDGVDAGYPAVVAGQ